MRNKVNIAVGDLSIFIGSCTALVLYSIFCAAYNEDPICLSIAYYACHIFGSSAILRCARSRPAQAS